MNWESSTDIYTLSCVKQRAGGKLLHRTGSSAWHSVMMQKGEIWGLLEGGLREK